MTNKLDAFNIVTARGLADMIRITTRTKRSLFIHGSFGLGKSAVVRQICDAEGIGLVEERLSQVAPEDAGVLLPRAEHGDVLRAKPDIIRRVEDSFAKHGRACLFLDEFNSASGMTQAAFGYELLHDRSLSGYKLPPNTVVIAAGNLATDRGIVNKMPAPASNRCAHVHFSGPTFDEWAEDYAMPAELHPSLVTALSQMPQYLCGKADPSEERTPTPRSWDIASDYLKALDAGASVSQQLVVLSSCVGDDAALKCKTVLDFVGQLPTFAELLREKGACRVPDSVPAQYFCAMSFAYQLDSALHGADVLTYIRRFPKEMQALFARTLGAQKKLSLLGGQLSAFVSEVGEFSSSSAYMKRAS